MSNNRLAEFNQHRAEVLKAHLQRDKTYLAVRSKRRAHILLGVMQTTIGTVVVLMLLKSLALATNSPSDYARMIAPAVQGLDDTHPIAVALRPDELTQNLANMLRPLINDAPPADVAFGPPLPPDMASPTATPES